jgi:hypothetical protein
MLRHSIGRLGCGKGVRSVGTPLHRHGISLSRMTQACCRLYQSTTTHRLQPLLKMHPSHAPLPSPSRTRYHARTDTHARVPGLTHTPPCRMTLAPSVHRSRSFVDLRALEKDKNDLNPNGSCPSSLSFTFGSDRMPPFPPTNTHPQVLHTPPWSSFRSGCG